MGYRSNFIISLTGGDPESYKQIFDEIREQSGYNYDELYSHQAAVHDASWCNMQEDLAAVARRHPELVIEVNVEGEDRDDNWIRRFRGTETESVLMTSSWPPFERIRLPKDKALAEHKSKTYVASLIEVTDDGEVFASLHSGDNPRKVADSVVSALETERAERSLDIIYDPDDIFTTVAIGTAVTGPEIIETAQSVRFHLAANVKEN